MIPRRCSAISLPYNQFKHLRNFHNPTTRSLSSASTSSSPQQTHSSKASSYIEANKEWDDLALHYPLIHNPTGIAVHLVGVHHASRASVDRVHKVVSQLKPSVVALEMDIESMQRWNRILARNDNDDDGMTGSSTSRRKEKPKVVHLVNSSTISGMQSGSMTDLSVRDEDQARLSLRGFDATTTGMNVDSVTNSRNAVSHGNLFNLIINFLRRLPANIPIRHSQKIPNHPTTNTTQHSNPTNRLYETLNNAIKNSPSNTKNRQPTWITLLRSLFGRIKSSSVQVHDKLAQDAGTPHELRTALRLWGLFHPLERYYWIEMRDAVMTERIRKIVKALNDNGISSRRLGNGGGKVHASLGGAEKGRIDDKMVEAGSEEVVKLNRVPVVVAIVGKSHVFGIADLWERFVANERFSKSNGWMRGNGIVGLDSLMDNVPEDLMLDHKALLRARLHEESVKNAKATLQEKTEKKTIVEDEEGVFNEVIKSPSVQAAKRSFTYID
ncbi:hypothetical protein HDU76_007772 [Blyttiomyces sp. JEL0837]|nr:hypothetical protein HDU76_007772 [Blyttiomyces sp. JEL0837]